MAVRKPYDIGTSRRGNAHNDITLTRQIFGEHPQWPVIDVTGRAIEETAVIILESLKERDDSAKNARAAIV